MKVGDKVIYFKPAKSAIGGGNIKMEAEIVRLARAQAYVLLANGEKKRVCLENLQRAK
jgi:hypothetical protein